MYEHRRRAYIWSITMEDQMLVTLLGPALFALLGLLAASGSFYSTPRRRR